VGRPVIWFPVLRRSAFACKCSLPAQKPLPQDGGTCALQPRPAPGSVATRTANLRPRIIGFLDLLNNNCFDTRSLKHLACDFHVTSHEGHQFLSLRSIRNRC